MSKDAIFDDRRKALEDSFFRDQDQAALAALRTAREAAGHRDALAAASGVKDAATLDRLVELGVRAETLAAFSLLPLVAVAWADGHVDEKERSAIARASREAGVADDSPAGKVLAGWLASPPSTATIDSWIAYTKSLCAEVDAAHRAALKHDVLGRARTVAEAAGGFLGLTSPVSEAEAAMLGRLETAFD